MKRTRFNIKHSLVFGNLKKQLSLCLMLSIITIAAASYVTKAQTLVLIVKTDKFYYLYRDVVRIGGIVTYNQKPVDEGLVAIQIVDPKGKNVIVRTVPVVSTPSATPVELISFFPCDRNLNPKSVFTIPGYIYFYAIVKSKVPYDIRILFVISAYDFDHTPIGINYIETTLFANGIVGQLAEFYVEESWRSKGNGIAYASVLSEWPKNQGYPYCPEINTTFTIVNTIPQQIIEGIANSSFHAAFRLHPNAPFGNYHIYATAYCMGLTAIGTGGFVRVTQELGDLNYDRQIDIFDVVLVTACYDAQSGSFNWNPSADLILDGKIDIFDVVLVTSKYGKEY